MFGWNDRPTTAEVRHRIGGDNPARVVTIGYGSYEVTIPDDTEAAITYKRPHYQNSDPRQTFPNMEVRDGEMRIPLDDVVSSILSRVDPAEIAIALWGDETVRANFIEAMVTRYSEMNVGDADRRKVLEGVKEAVHSAALDKLANAMASLEYSVTKRAYLYHEINHINETLAHYDVTRPPRGDEQGPQPLTIKHEDHLPELKIGGTAWNEARGYWRDEVLRQFPIPTDEAEQTRSGTAATILPVAAAQLNEGQQS